MCLLINKNTEDLCLVVTEKCNLNCSYCQSNKFFSGSMTFACAKSYIDAYLRVTESPAPSITFMGGEPFVAFKTIKDIVEYVKLNYPQTKLFYTIVTNGTLVHGSIQQWIKENEESVQVILSLDGIQEYHDVNRCNSFRLIDLDFFKGLKKNIVNTVFSLATVNNMAENVIALHQQGFQVKGFIADGEQWNISSLETIAKQLFQLTEYYLDNPNVYPLSLLSMPIHHLVTDQPLQRCGNENYVSVSISADGKEYACHRCTPFENHGSWQIPEQYIGLVNAQHLLQECASCPLERICNACPASNASLINNEELALVVCKMRKLLFKANAYFYIKMLMSKNEYVALKHLSIEMKNYLIKAAKIIIELI